MKHHSHEIRNNCIKDKLIVSSIVNQVTFNPKTAGFYFTRTDLTTGSFEFVLHDTILSSPQD